MRIPFALFAIAAATAAVAACAPTQNHAEVGANGHLYQRIVCRAETPRKCTKRAEEICGQYTVIEPIHRMPAGESYQLQLLVECQDPTASAQPPGSAPPAAPPPPPPAAPPQ
jgi:hypothetical protein